MRLKRRNMSKSNESLLLEKALDRAIRDLGNHAVGSEEYSKTLDHVVTLHKMLVEEKTPSMSKDTMAVVGGNLLGILMIIKHEFVNVVTSRAVGLLLKPRI
jgi:hypothetical protein